MGVWTRGISAVYTGIKKPESFSHSGFSLKVARQLPLNTPKNLNRKTHLRSVIFWNSAEISLFFCQCKCSLQSRRYYSGFWSRGIRDLQRNHPTAARDVMRTTRVRSKVERSRACAPLTKTQVWDSGFFAHALFVPKTPNVMGFSGSVNGTTRNPGFLDLGFCQCKWAYCCTSLVVSDLFKAWGFANFMFKLSQCHVNSARIVQKIRPRPLPTPPPHCPTPKNQNTKLLCWSQGNTH